MNENNFPELKKELVKIEKKIGELEKKMSEKWVLPVLLVVLTSMMGVSNYLIQRYYANSDVYGNKLKEKIAELRATETINFFKRSISNLDTLDGSFQQICQFGISKDQDNNINLGLVKINTLVQQQLVANPDLIADLKKYADFISSNEFDITGKDPGQQKRLAIYEDSKKLYLKVTAKINASIDSLVK